VRSGDHRASFTEEHYQQFLPVILPIKIHHVLIDLLHLLLRVTDQLFLHLIDDVLFIRGFVCANCTSKRKSCDAACHIDRLATLVAGSAAIGVNLQFWQKSNDSSGTSSFGDSDAALSWTTLNGDDKHKLFTSLDLSNVLPPRRSACVRELWDLFLRIHDRARQDKVLDDDQISSIEADARAFIKMLREPSLGMAHEPNYHEGIPLIMTVGLVSISFSS
jgi:hypothetical protein